jgi:hypothetical protein
MARCKIIFWGQGAPGATQGGKNDGKRERNRGAGRGGLGRGKGGVGRHLAAGEKRSPARDTRGVCHGKWEFRSSQRSTN